ncbi:MAG: dihydroorotase, partial [Methyloceanibacter sp.]
MVETFDILFKGGTVVNHTGEAPVDIGVRDGRIRAIGDIDATRAGRTVDARGLHVLPGVIDT